MRTLDELLEVAKNAQAEYELRVEQARKAYQAELEAVEQAKKEAEAAIAAGDREAHASAAKEEEFHKKRASLMYKQTVSPYFTNADFNALVNEINSACRTEQRPLYQRLFEITQEWNGIVGEIEKLAEKAAAADRHMSKTGIPTSGMASAAWHHVGGNGVNSDISHVFKLGSAVRASLNMVYKPAKKEA